MAYNPKDWPFLEIKFKDLPTDDWHCMFAVVRDLAAKVPCMSLLYEAMVECDHRHNEIAGVMIIANESQDDRFVPPDVKKHLAELESRES